MARLDFALRNISVTQKTIKGQLEITGEDLQGKEFRMDVPLEVANSREWDISIPGTICKVHAKVWLDGPRRACAVGHIQCGPGRHPMKGPVCVDF